MKQIFLYVPIKSTLHWAENCNINLRNNKKLDTSDSRQGRVVLCVFFNKFFFESLTVSYWPYCVYISIALFDQLATVVVEAKFFEEDFSTGPKSHNRSFLLDFE